MAQKRSSKAMMIANASNSASDDKENPEVSGFNSVFVD